MEWGKCTCNKQTRVGTNTATCYLPSSARCAWETRVPVLGSHGLLQSALSPRHSTNIIRILMAFEARIWTSALDLDLDRQLTSLSRLFSPLTHSGYTCQWRMFVHVYAETSYDPWHRCSTYRVYPPRLPARRPDTIACNNNPFHTTKHVISYDESWARPPTKKGNNVGAPIDSSTWRG